MLYTAAAMPLPSLSFGSNPFRTLPVHASACDGRSETVTPKDEVVAQMAADRPLNVVPDKSSAGLASNSAGRYPSRPPPPRDEADAFRTQVELAFADPLPRHATASATTSSLPSVHSATPESASARSQHLESAWVPLIDPDIHKDAADFMDSIADQLMVMGFNMDMPPPPPPVLRPPIGAEKDACPAWRRPRPPPLAHRTFVHASDGKNTATHSSVDIRQTALRLTPFDAKVLFASGAVVGGSLVGLGMLLSARRREARLVRRLAEEFKRYADRKSSRSSGSGGTATGIDAQDRTMGGTGSSILKTSATTPTSFFEGPRISRMVSPDTFSAFREIPSQVLTKSEVSEKSAGDAGKSRLEPLPATDPPGVAKEGPDASNASGISVPPLQPVEASALPADVSTRLQRVEDLLAAMPAGVAEHVLQATRPSESKVTDLIDRLERASQAVEAALQRHNLVSGPASEEALVDVRKRVAAVQAALEDHQASKESLERDEIISRKLDQIIAGSAILRSIEDHLQAFQRDVQRDLTDLRVRVDENAQSQSMPRLDTLFEKLEASLRSLDDKLDGPAQSNASRHERSAATQPTLSETIQQHMNEFDVDFERDLQAGQEMMRRWLGFREEPQEPAPDAGQTPMRHERPTKIDVKSVQQSQAQSDVRSAAEPEGVATSDPSPLDGPVTRYFKLPPEQAEDRKEAK